MNVSFKEFKDEVDTLVEFLISDTWEFYGTPNLKPERIRENYKNNYYNGEDCKTFWIILNDNEKVGMLRMYDLQDRTSLFDIRINSKYKNMGIGTIAVKWLTDYVFSNYADMDRIEGNTRQDNYGMRCVLHKCGYVKEAHYRNGWPCSDGKIYDAMGYSIIKEDWKEKKVTNFTWDDFKC